MPFSNFDKCDLDAYIGDIDMDSYVKGVYLIKRQDNYYLYYGGFDSSGKKSGNDCFYYNSTEDKVLYGTILAEETGLGTIRSKCPLFNSWIERIEEACL